MKTSEAGIKKIVWDGAYVQVDESHAFRGAVGRTHAGTFKAAEVEIYSERSPSGKTAFSPESWNWSAQEYQQKEQAIFGARERVARTVREYRQLVGEVSENPPARQCAAEKYGAAGESLDRNMQSHSRSRR